MSEEPLLFEKSVKGRKCVDLPSEKYDSSAIPEKYLRKDPPELPEISEVDLIRHFTNLSSKNFGVDKGFYPLGSCTMKYNPKINEDSASLEGFTDIHPLENSELTQGVLKLLFDFEKMLCELFGFDAFTLQPDAGAHGELTALLMAKKYFEDKKQGNRKKVIVPDSSHGTNPSSAAIAGFEVVCVKSDKNGEVDLEHLKSLVDENTALMMLTNPNTLGLFDRNILKISEIIHGAGALMYMDGANANAILGRVKPAKLGFDMTHINLHKTFSTPHGGGGPGSGPVGVVKTLERYLPVPRIVKQNEKFAFSEDFKDSIGKVSAFYGNIGVIVKAYTYIKKIGKSGIKPVSGNAVLNANYLMNKLKKYYYLPYDRICQHEFVLSAKWQKEKSGIKALDIAKRLIDYGFHPPTIYFPLIVEEAMMIEPTETESKETLDAFADAMIAIAKECEEDPNIVKTAPHSTSISRLDEVKAIKDLNICYKG